MTLAGLLANIRREAQTDLPDGELAEMLNEEQRELAVSLKLPSRTVTVGGITSDFQLPPDAQYNALLSAHANTGGSWRALETWTIAEADRLWSSWNGSELSGGTPFAIIYDPANISAPIRPLPHPSQATTLRLTVALKPADMAALTDIPFGGELADTHQVLAYGVIARLLLRNGDERAGAYFSKAQQLKELAYQETRPHPARIRRHEHNFRRRQ